MFKSNDEVGMELKGARSRRFRKSLVQTILKLARGIQPMYNIIFKRFNEELAVIGKEYTNHDHSYRFLENVQRRFEKFS